MNVATATKFGTPVAKAKLVGLSEEALARLAQEGEKRAWSSRVSRWIPFAQVMYNPEFRGPRHVPTSQNPSELPVVDQKRSGRCWIMAGLNLLRHDSAKRLGRARDFELSGAYIMFYDKLEKSLLFLDQMWALKNRPVDNRTVQYLLQHPMSDGGQFSMFVDLVEKYGCVPAEVMPDTHHAGNTKELNDLLSHVLRFFAEDIRAQDSDQGKNAVIWKACTTVYQVLVDALGPVPREFVLDHKTTLTPQAFYASKLLPDDLASYVALVSVPQEDRPMFHTFYIAGLGSLVKGRPVKYLNVPLDVMKRAVMDTLDMNRRVWFGSDVNSCRHEKHAVLDFEAFEYERVLGCQTRLPRELRLKYRQSAVTHAMVFCGYHKNPDGEPSCFRVENSWGPTHKDGFLDMTDAWFDEFVYEVLVPPAVLTEKLKQIWHSADSTPLPLWDPLGVLLGDCCNQ